MGQLSKQEVIKSLRGKEDLIRKWIKDRPSVNRSYDDLIDDVMSGELQVNLGPKGQDSHSYAWKSFSRRNKGPSDAGGWYQSDNDGRDNIYIPDTEWGKDESLPHELMHNFASHQTGGRNVPKKISKYQQLDMKHKGWLPSFHPGGRRPTVKGLLGKTKLGQWWNDNRATKSVEYSDKKGYHPWFDEHSFDTALQEREKLNFKSLFGLALTKKDKKEGKDDHAGHH